MMNDKMKAALRAWFDSARYIGPEDIVEWTLNYLRSQQEPAGEVHPDDAAVDAFAVAMKEKLAAARAKGRGGWNGDEPGMQQRLSDMLRAHVEKGDPRDVANFCMFLHQRGESILPQPAEQRGQPKRRPYNASGSLSEYGVFPECDAQQPAEGEEIMVNTPYDVFTLPLQPSGLDGNGPRFVVHVPGPEHKAYAGCTIWRGNLRISVTETEAIERRIGADEAFCALVQRALDNLAAAWNAAQPTRPSPSTSVGMEDIIEAFDEISRLCRHLRQGGPAPEDLQNLSAALDEAVDIATNMLHALAAHHKGDK